MLSFSPSGLQWSLVAVHQMPSTLLGGGGLTVLTTWISCLTSSQGSTMVTGERFHDTILFLSFATVFRFMQHNFMQMGQVPPEATKFKQSLLFFF